MSSVDESKVSCVRQCAFCTCYTSHQRPTECRTCKQSLISCRGANCEPERVEHHYYNSGRRTSEIVAPSCANCKWMAEVNPQLL